MQDQLQDERNSARRGAKALGLACLGLGGFVAWGFARRWDAPAASVEGRAVAEALGAWARVSGGLLGAGIGLFGALLVLRGSLAERLPAGRAAGLLALGLAACVCLGASWAAGEEGPEHPSEATYTVEVIGQQFEWLVRYPGPDGVLGRTRAELVHVTRNPAGLDAKDPAARDDILLRQRLWLPAGEPCRVQLRSLDVLHSFNIEDFRIRRAVLPSYPSEVSFTPIRAGDYELSCASLCGLGHYRMSGMVKVVPRVELDAWLAEQEAWL